MIIAAATMRTVEDRCRSGLHVVSPAAAVGTRDWRRDDFMNVQVAQSLGWAPCRPHQKRNVITFIRLATPLTARGVIEVRESARGEHVRTVHSHDPTSVRHIHDRDVELVEILGAVPSGVETFGRSLISTRRLGLPLDLRDVTVDGDSRQVDGFSLCADDLGHLDGWENYRRWAEGWVEGFARLNDVSRLCVRLWHARRPTCPRFHVDNVTTRLIVTLAGPGTEWLAAHRVETLRDKQTVSPTHHAHLDQLAPGSVGIFKGAAFDRANCAGVTHRSPQVNCDRIVMTVDAR